MGGVVRSKGCGRTSGHGTGCALLSFTGTLCMDPATPAMRTSPDRGAPAFLMATAAARYAGKAPFMSDTPLPQTHLPSTSSAGGSVLRSGRPFSSVAARPLAGPDTLQRPGAISRSPAADPARRTRPWFGLAAASS